jgi:hypothetical protein
VRRGAYLTNYRGASPPEDPPRRSSRKERQPLPPLATGIVLGLWIAVMVVLSLVVVPTLFSTCSVALPPP